MLPGCWRDTFLFAKNGLARAIECSPTIGLVESARYLSSCDHQRSHEWFLESILNHRSKCLFIGVRCPTLDRVLSGRCTCDDSPSACAIMGIDADQMYLNGVHNNRPRRLKQLLGVARPSIAHLSEFTFAQVHSQNATLTKSVQPTAPTHLEEANSRNSRVKSAEENWYELSNRWFLKTSDKPNYCLNQYQLLVFLGGGAEAKQINLILSILGSSGQLINQPIEFRRSTYRPTIQPLCILLEASHSLGQIESVAIGWQEVEPIKFDFEKTLVNFRGHKLAQFESSTTIRKVVVSPWQVSFGKSAGRNSRCFSTRTQNYKLGKDQTVRLRLSSTGKCFASS